jgi:FkbM family methyltransferase
MIQRRLKDAVDRALRPLGLQLRRLHPEREEHARVKHILDQRGIRTVLDIGANVGQFARGLRAAGFVGTIVSFEPLADAHHRLVDAAAEDANWTVAGRCALGDTAGELTIHRAGNSVSSSLLPMLDSHTSAAQESRIVGRELVPVRRLDLDPTVQRCEAPMFAKIDTQGYELQVLRGADAVLPRIHALMIEASLIELYAGQPLLPEVITELTKRGFVIADLLSEFQHPENGQMLQVNLIAVRA